MNFLLQSIISSAQYPQFLQEAVGVFIKILKEGEPQFISEQNSQVNAGKQVYLFLDTIFSVF